MTEKLKVYACSIMAFSLIADYEGTGPGTFVEHTAALIPAASVQKAADGCRECALKRWPISSGWYNHQAVIVPVTKHFFDTALAAHAAEAINMSDDEAEQVFTFK